MFRLLTQDIAFGRKITWVFDPILSFHVEVQGAQSVQGATFQAQITVSHSRHLCFTSYLGRGGTGIVLKTG